ncbi:MAG: gfo/Idh/MocA family oxidoreductase, partial [Planctomycetota bacterium]
AVTAVKNSGIVEGETYPSNTMLKFEFPERDGLVPCEFFWYDGGNLPSDDIISKLPDSFRRRVEKQKTGGRKTSAAVVVGDKGMLFSPDDYGAKWYLLPKDEFAEYTPPTQSLPRIGWQGGTDQRQKWEFVESCKGEYEPGTMSNFGYAGRLTETILVGNLALRVDAGQRIEWDAKALRSTNVESVNKFVQREYRDGWSLEG